jgi:teichuronic acid biosynthesis glycosyltransferase TuaC
VRVLIVTKIFPNAAEPEFAPYNVHQFSGLARRCEVTLWAPVPWVPFARRFGRRSPSRGPST